MDQESKWYSMLKRLDQNKNHPNVRSYKASKEETHPWVTGNGETTLDFFAAEFGFTPEESVAILGAHTMGKFHGHVADYDYTWTSGETGLFNNR